VPIRPLLLKNTAHYSSLNVSGISLVRGNFQQATIAVWPRCRRMRAAWWDGCIHAGVLRGTLDATLEFAGQLAYQSRQQAKLSHYQGCHGAPVARLSTTSVNFGTLPQGTKSAVQTVTLTTQGSGTLKISNVYLTPADSFNYSNRPWILSCHTQSEKARVVLYQYVLRHPGIQPSTST